MGSFLLDEFDKTLNRSVARVFKGFRFLACSVQLDGRKSSDVIRNVIERGIDLGDNDLVRVAGVCGGKLLVFGSKVLAMSTLFVSLFHVENHTHGA